MTAEPISVDQVRASLDAHAEELLDLAIRATDRETRIALASAYDRAATHTNLFVPPVRGGQ